MTEEIIIDGVDVNNCDLYCSRGYCMDDNISLIDCKDRHDCEYKQLKRLEQENKELKEQAQLDGECIDKLIEARDMYAKALEEIRENLVKLKTNDEDDFTYEYSKIEDKINEVLGNEDN